MEKLYRMAKELEEDCKHIAQDLYSNNPGLPTSNRVSMENIEDSIGVIMAKFSTLSVGISAKMQCQIEDDNNALFS